MLSSLVLNKYRIGKNGCHLPNCRICGYTKKYLQDKARYKLLLNILPRNSASYMRNLAAPNYTVSRIPEILTKKEDYIILVKIYDLLIRHVKEKHNGSVFLGGDFTTCIENFTKKFSLIEFYIFSSFKINILMTCIPELFESVAEQLRRRGYDAFIYKIENAPPLNHFNRIYIYLFCNIDKPDNNNVTAKFNKDTGDLGEYMFCVHIPNGRSNDLETHTWNPLNFRKKNKHSWLKHSDLSLETQKDIDWITGAKRLTHNFFLGTMFDSVLHPDGKRIFRFSWPDVTRENDYIEEVAYEKAYIEKVDNNHIPVIPENNEYIKDCQPQFPVKNLLTLAWENIATQYDD